MPFMFQCLIVSMCLGLATSSSIWGSWFGGGSSTGGASRGFLSRDLKATLADLQDVEEEAAMAGISLAQMQATYTKASGPQAVYTKEISAKLEEFASPTSEMRDVLGTAQKTFSSPMLESSSFNANTSAHPVHAGAQPEPAVADSAELAVPAEFATAEPAAAVAELTELATAEPAGLAAAKPIQLAAAEPADEIVEAKIERPAYQRTAARNKEASLIESLRHMQDGDEAVECVTHCRYGDEVRHPWRECLDKCVTNHLMHSTFMSMLPSEHHEAHGRHVEMPEALKKRLEKRKQRSSEL